MSPVCENADCGNELREDEEAICDYCQDRDDEGGLDQEAEEYWERQAEQAKEDRLDARDEAAEWGGIDWP